jgi:succinate-semialdehyde dehydrogenase/glutarate-semialdehyde dehydrogenase
MTVKVATRGFRVQDLVTGEVRETFNYATDDEVRRTLDLAETGFATWRARPIEERARIVSRVAELFDERKQELAEIIAVEMGKPVEEGIGEVEFASAIFQYYADNGPEFAATEELPTESEGTAYLERLPLGAVFGIMPWNFPYYQVARFAAPNLVLGNVIVLKHANICPQSSQAIQQIMDDAGVPEGVYTNIFATHDQVADIIADPRIQGVSLTGSERAGAVIAAEAGKNLKKAVLELGGSNAWIVLDHHDPAVAAQEAWDARMYNTGQACDSIKRMIVMDDIYDAFVEKMVEIATNVKQGDPLRDYAGTYPPLSSRGAAENLAEQVQRAVDNGATLHVGGTLDDDTSSYFSPAVLTGVTRENPVYREELFGPVVVVHKVSSEEEALELANDSQYGLGAGVYSEDKDRARMLASRLEVGMVGVNTPGGEGAELPFGGVKNSGYGRELGPLGMDEFVNKRLFFIAD